MKVKKSKRILALIMSALMVIGIMPMDWATKVVSAADTVYTFESKDLATAAAGTYKDGDEVKAGTSDYFTLIMSAKTKIDSSIKTFDDNYETSNRLNLGGAVTTAKNAVKFTTANPATVKVWWVEGGDDNRQQAILDSTGAQVQVTDVTLAKNATAISTFKLEDAGTFYLGGATNNNYIFKVEITETPKVVVKNYTLNAADLTAAAQGTFKDGDEAKVGTDSFFTNIYSAKTKIDSSVKTFDDGYEATQRINFGGAASTAKNAVKFTTEGTAKVKVWWVEGGDDNRQMAILNTAGEQVKVTAETLAKNATAISTFELADPGTYYLGGATNNNYIFKIEVEDTVGGAPVPVVRKPWAEVAAPIVTSVDNADGKIKVNFDMVIGKDGADSVKIYLMDKDNNVIDSLNYSAEGTSGSKEFTPDASGDYKVKVVASREGEEDKTSAVTDVNGFSFPLATPSFSSATSKGNGVIELVWNSVKEATGYEVSYSTDGTNYSAPQSFTGTTASISGLTIGTKYTFKLVAVRNTEKSEAAAIDATVTASAQTVWAFSAFGQGVNSNASDCGYTGNANDGSVTVWDLNSKGKLVPNSTDGLSFYYTAIPASQNFTLSAKVTVDQWTYTNGQEGFGMMACDRVGVNGDASVFWNNSYMNSVTKVEYYADNEGKVTDDTTASKISMKLGVGSQAKTGVTNDNIDKFLANDSDALNSIFQHPMTSLETSQAANGAGTYNIVGNYTNTDATFGATVKDNLVTFDMTIQKNNTGYFVSYTDKNGNTTTQKYYDTKALEQLDTDNVYAGFFASRTSKITVTDINLTTIDPKDDKPAEEKPVTYVTPNYKVVSASTSNVKDYTLVYTGNADGHVVIKDAAGAVVAEQDVKAGDFVNVPTTLSYGANSYTVSMTPNADYVPGEDMKLSSYDAAEIAFTVTFNELTGDYVYVGPEGKTTGAGTKEDPVDIYTAVKYAVPGQKLVLLEGTYNLTSTVTVPLGTNGASDKMIVLMADPDAASRPVFDFGGNCEGLVVGGNFWYFTGFDVTKSANGKDGIRLSGSSCVFDNVNAYNNGNTGLQISRFSADVTKEQWPANNLILNCTSYGNADAGYEDADGFAAKLTIGSGNVFNGCIAHNNADDGWDLFAKPETGAIGSATIENCVAYANGYLEDGTNAGNGNGFKMGGSSITGYHKLINSVAFDNKAKGIDSNSCPDIQISNSTSFNNGGANVALYTNDAANTDFSASGIISYRTEGKDVAETFKLKGTQDKTKVYQATDYFWNCTEAGTNNSNGTVKDDWFVTVDTKMNYTTHVYSETLVTRNADNTINMNGLLVLTDAGAAATGSKAGAVMKGNASWVASLSGNPSTGLAYKKDNGGSGSGSGDGTGSGSGDSTGDVNTGDTANTFGYVMLMLMAGMSVVVLLRKKREVK